MTRFVKTSTGTLVRRRKSLSESDKQRLLSDYERWSGGHAPHETEEKDVRAFVDGAMTGIDHADGLEYLLSLQQRKSKAAGEPGFILTISPLGTGESSSLMTFDTLDRAMAKASTYGNGYYVEIHDRGAGNTLVYEAKNGQRLKMRGGRPVKGARS